MAQEGSYIDADESAPVASVESVPIDSAKSLSGVSASATLAAKVAANTHHLKKLMYALITVFVLFLIYQAVVQFGKNQESFLGLEERDDPAADASFIEDFVQRLRDTQARLLQSLKGRT